MNWVRRGLNSLMLNEGLVVSGDWFGIGWAYYRGRIMTSLTIPFFTLFLMSPNSSWLVNSHFSVRCQLFRSQRLNEMPL